MSSARRTDRFFSTAAFLNAEVIELVKKERKDTSHRTTGEDGLKDQPIDPEGAEEEDTGAISQVCPDDGAVHIDEADRRKFIDDLLTREEAVAGDDPSVGATHILNEDGTVTRRRYSAY